MNLQTFNFNKYIFFAGGTLLLIGTVAKLTMYQQFGLCDYAPYIFSAGAFCLLLYQILQAVATRKASNFRIKRLYALAFLMSVLLVPAAYLMFKGYDLWVLLVLIYSVVTVFLSFRTKSKE